MKNKLTNLTVKIPDVSHEPAKLTPSDEEEKQQAYEYFQKLRSWGVDPKAFLDKAVAKVKRNNLMDMELVDGGVERVYSILTGLTRGSKWTVEREHPGVISLTIAPNFEVTEQSLSSLLMSLSFFGDIHGLIDRKDNIAKLTVTGSKDRILLLFIGLKYFDEKEHPHLLNTIYVSSYDLP